MMDLLVINAGSRILGELNRPAGGAPLEFTEGQVIRAVVRHAALSLIRLDTGEASLLARTEVALQPGEPVLLKVAEVGPQRVMLRIVDRPAVIDSSSTASLPERLAGLLAFWGMEADDINVRIAEALFREGQSLKPADLQVLRAWWQALPNAHTDDIRPLVHLYARRIPPGAEALAMARGWLEGAPAIAERLGEVQRLAAEALSYLDVAPGRSHYQMPELVHTLRTLLASVEGWQIALHLPPQQTSKQLAALVEHLTTPPERLLSEEVGGIPLKPLQTKLRALAEVVTHNLRQEAAGALHTEGLPQGVKEVLQHLSSRLESLARDLGVVHFANLSDTRRGGAEPCFVVPIPLATADGLHTAELRIYRRNEGEALDPRNLRLSLLLDIPGLGELVVNLAIYERWLHGEILSARQETRLAVESELELLREGLSRLGYYVDALRCDLLPRPPKGEDRDCELQKLTQVDVSV